MSSWLRDDGVMVLADELEMPITYGGKDYEPGDILFWCPPYCKAVKRVIWDANHRKVAP